MSRFLWAALLLATAATARDLGAEGRFETIAPDDWPGFGRVSGEPRFSALAAIDARNVGRLGLAWSFDLPRGNSVSGAVEAGGIRQGAGGVAAVFTLAGGRLTGGKVTSHSLCEM